MSANLPEFLRQMLASCPHAGGGVHAWLYNTARQLHAHMGPETVADLLEANAAQCGRHIPRREIEQAVSNSKATAWQPRETGRPVVARSGPKWPSVNTEQRAAIVRDGLKLADLWEASPVRFDDDESHTEEIIDSLFPGNPLLCCGRSNSDFATKPREAWRGKLSALGLIVPSPMSKPIGLTQEGKESAHTLESTGPRRFLIVEFDTGTFDEHAALLYHLAGYGPLALAVHSGSKSLHGWFLADGRSEETLIRFFRYAVSLGADRATWTRSQFVRMPEGTRENGKPQRVYYFNPGVLP